MSTVLQAHARRETVMKRVHILALVVACSTTVDEPEPETVDPVFLDFAIDEQRFVGERDYWLYVPSTLDIGPATPVLMNFHGSTPDFVAAVDSHLIITEAREHAEAMGYALVVPHARLLGDRQAWDSDADSVDYDFVADILDAVDVEIGIDRERVYATGYSSGGYLSFGLACHRPELIGAAASVAGGIRSTEDCPALGDLPALFIHGTDDARVDFEGTVAEVEAWRAAASCASTSTVTHEQGDVRCERWDDCTVEFCTVDAGGHTWPGTNGSQVLLSTVGEGTTSTDLSANDHIWAFFTAAP